MKVSPSPPIPSRSYKTMSLVQIPTSSQSSASVLRSAAARSSFTFPDGCTYTGSLNKKGLPHGEGISTWPNGDMQYEGQFENGEFHGHGIFKKNGYCYQGDFHEGNRHGTGVATFPNGSSYSGVYVNNKRHGRGVFTYANGDEYSGGWKGNKKHGLGTYAWSSGRRYVGIWKEDLNHGVGIETNASGNVVHAGWLRDDDFENRSKLTTTSTVQFEESCYVSTVTSVQR